MHGMICSFMFSPLQALLGCLGGKRLSSSLICAWSQILTNITWSRRVLSVSPYYGLHHMNTSSKSVTMQDWNQDHLKKQPLPTHLLQHSLGSFRFIACIVFSIDHALERRQVCLIGNTVIRRSIHKPYMCRRSSTSTSTRAKGLGVTIKCNRDGGLCYGTNELFSWDLPCGSPSVLGGTGLWRTLEKKWATITALHPLLLF